MVERAAERWERRDFKCRANQTITSSRWHYPRPYLEHIWTVHVNGGPVVNARVVLGVNVVALAKLDEAGSHLLYVRLGSASVWGEGMGCVIVFSTLTLSPFSELPLLSTDLQLTVVARRREDTVGVPHLGHISDSHSTGWIGEYGPATRSNRATFLKR